MVTYSLLSLRHRPPHIASGPPDETNLHLPRLGIISTGFLERLSFQLAKEIGAAVYIGHEESKSVSGTLWQGVKSRTVVSAGLAVQTSGSKLGQVE